MARPRVQGPRPTAPVKADKTESNKAANKKSVPMVSVESVENDKIEEERPGDFQSQLKGALGQLKPVQVQELRRVSKFIVLGGETDQ